MSDIGKLLLVAGGLLLVIGAILMISGRAGLPVGRLPGDVVYRGKNTVVYFPIMTSIVLSIVLSLIFWAVGRFSR